MADDRWIHVLGNNEEALKSFYAELETRKLMAMLKCIKAETMVKVREAQASYQIVVELEGRINNVLAEAKHKLREVK